MIKEYLPITNIRLNIISELYQKELNLVELSKKLNKTKQTLHQTLQDMSMIKKKNNVYYIEKDFINLFKKAIIQNLIELRLKKYYDIILYIKKYYNPEEIILFGSFAKGNKHEKSDIDIYVISKIDEETNLNNRLKLSKLFKKEIQIINVNPNIHLTQKDKYSHLYQKISKNIEIGIKII